MNYYGELETYYFRGPLFIKEMSAREQILQNNLKNGSWPEYFNKNTDKTNIDPTQATVAHNLQKFKSVHFEDPYLPLQY